jgi:hypothetical protein
MPNQLKSITLTTKQWNWIEEILSYYEDKGPTGEGWQSDELIELCKIFNNSLNSNNLLFENLLNAAVNANQYLAYLASEGRLKDQNEIDNWSAVQFQLFEAIRKAKEV